MQKQDWPQFLELMRSAAQITNTYGKDIGNAATVMFAALGRFSLVDVSAAVMRHCERGNGDFPTLADIVRNIEGDLDDRTAMAWAEVDAAAQIFGGDRSVRFSDPATHYAIQHMRGWESLGTRLKDGDGTWLKKDFAQFYSIGVRRGVTWADVPAVLEGAFTRHVYDAAAQKCFPVNELPALAAGAAA